MPSASSLLMPCRRHRTSASLRGAFVQVPHGQVSMLPPIPLRRVTRGCRTSAPHGLRHQNSFLSSAVLGHLARNPPHQDLHPCGPMEKAAHTSKPWLGPLSSPNPFQSNGLEYGWYWNTSAHNPHFDECSLLVVKDSGSLLEVRRWAP